MKKCSSCGEILKIDFIGREETCPFCHADLHTCRNCAHYDETRYNSCRETEAERILEKDRKNFCDFFIFRTSEKTDFSAKKEQLEKLFKI